MHSRSCDIWFLLERSVSEAVRVLPFALRCKRTRMRLLRRRFSSYNYSCQQRHHFITNNDSPPRTSPVQRYGQMLWRGFSSDSVAYTVISRGGNGEKAVGFLQNMIRSGLKPNLVTYTALMYGFCKEGKLEEASSLYRMVKHAGIQPDEFMYATLIHGFCTGGDFLQTYHLLDDMENDGITPGIVTYNIVINGLCKVGRTSQADEVSKSIPGDVFTYTTLLHGYLKEEKFLGILETKRRAEEAGVCMDVIMCNVLIKALFVAGAPEEACAIFKGMPMLNLVADSVTYCTMIDGYCKISKIDEALEVFDDCKRTLISSPTCYSCIIYGLCMKGMIDMATKVFIELAEKGLEAVDSEHKFLIKVIFKEKGVEGVLNFVYRIENLNKELCDLILNAAICFLCKRGSVEAACDVYMVVKRKGSVTTASSYYSILKGLIHNGKERLSQLFLNVFLKEYGISEPKVIKIVVHNLCMKGVVDGLQFLDKMNDNNLAITFPVTIFKALTKDGRAMDAYKLFMGGKDHLPSMNVVDYSIMIDGLCKGGYLIQALDLCDFARKKGVAFNIVTYNSVINGLCQQGCLVDALRLFDSLEKIDLVPSEITYAILIDTLGKEGYLVDAKELFERMIFKGVDPNTRVYNSLIDNYCKFCQMEEAWELLVQLESRCLKPDGFSLSSMISGYCRKGDLEGALGFFFDFKKKGYLPDFLGFMHLMRGLCTKGRMEEARSILREMLETPSVVELINNVDYEVGTDSITSCLVHLCEQGSIQEAITILTEVGYVLFPIRRRCSSYNVWQKLKQHCEGEASVTEDSRVSVAPREHNSEPGLHNFKRVGRIPETSDYVLKNSQDIDFLYSEIASLCSRGELQKANRLAKDIISDLD